MILKLIAKFRFAIKISAADTEIRYPGDRIRYTPVRLPVDDPELDHTEGYVLRVVNSTHHDPPVLVAWKQSNYTSVSWKDPQDLTLQSRSEVANWEGR